MNRPAKTSCVRRHPPRGFCMAIVAAWIVTLAAITFVPARAGAQDGATTATTVRARAPAGRRTTEYRFEGLTLTGRLQKPQVTYFLRRVGAALRRHRLPHRSFLRAIGPRPLSRGEP